jgi:dynein heavy chain
MAKIQSRANSSRIPCLVSLDRTGAQIKYESFVEDINNLLNSGEVPNLFTKEDMGEICEKIAADAKKARGAETPEGQYAFFIERCRRNLHVVLCLSPIGART